MDKRKGRGKKPRQAVPALTHANTARAFRKLAMRDRGLAAALLREHPEFLEAKDGVGETALHYCAIEGHLEAVKWLAGLGAAVNATTLSGVTPLIHASQGGHKEVCRFLLDAGAEVHAKEAGGESALHVAARWGYSEICRMLLAAGADSSVRNGQDEIAADLALPRKRDKVLAVLKTKN